MKIRKLRNEEIGSLCLSLVHLLHAGVGAADALALMAQDEGDSRFCALLGAMAQSADEGKPLGRVFRESERFPRYVCALLDASERLGKTEQTLEALASHYEGRARMDERLRASLLYPAVLLLTMLVVVVVLLVWVLPVFNDVYAQLGKSLSGVASGLLQLGAALRHAMPTLCVLVFVLASLTALLCASDALRTKAADGWQRLFGGRGAAGKIAAARVAQALSLGMSSGLNDREAIELARSLAGENELLRRRCEDCLARLERGEALAAALRGSELLSGAQCRLLDAAVRSGRGEMAMHQIAQRMLEEGENALERAVGRIEPALVLCTSALVGLILLTVMLPLMHIMSGIG